MSQQKKRRWSDRARMILTLELAIVLPAAALIVFSVWNLRSIQRDRAVEAAIQRDFSQVLKIAEKRIYKQTVHTLNEVRSEFPCPEDNKDTVPQVLDRMLERNPQFAHAFFYEPRVGLVVRSNPARLDEKAFRKESEQFAEMIRWAKSEAREMASKLRQMEEKDGMPFYFSSFWPMWGDQMGYENLAITTLPHWPADRPVLAGLAFDSNYLREEYFPTMLNGILAEDQGGKNGNPVVMMVRMKKDYEPLAASAGWDGGRPEVERNFEMGFPGLVLAIKFHGTTIEALSQRFLWTSFLIIGGLSLILAFGVWHTYRNVTREMALAKLKSDFVANVSHELRTPLSLIRLYAETLEMGRLTNPEKPQEYYRIIRKESERLTGLINNILDFSRIEAGRKEYDFRETNLAQLVRNTLEAYRYQIEQNGFAFEENISDGLPPVRVDREAIARSLLNLINNAVKYSAQDKYLGVKLYRDNGSVKLEVIDHGIGIPRTEQAKIFEKFYRSGTPLVHNTKGSGLGLSLVRHIVQAHGGQVSVESAPGKGSRFVIALPVNGGVQEQRA